MFATLLKLYERSVLRHPIFTLLAVFLIVATVGFYAKDFRLDASADSLLLENDQNLKYHRSISAKYGAEDFLVISYSPKQDLYASATLNDLRKLRDSLLTIERVGSVLSILDVPLIDSPRLTLGDLKNAVRTLETPDIDIALVRHEFKTSPLYSNLLVSPDGKTTALQVFFKRDATYHALLEKRNALREKRLEQPLTAEENKQLEQAVAAFNEYSAQLSEQEAIDIARVRAIMDNHRTNSELFLGGLPMIVADMIDFIRHDLAAFGLGVLVFLVGMLALIFRKLRWVILPMFCCFSSVFFMFGFLGLVGWKVTVVSSNFTSLLLIITLSLCVHLIVQYNELYTKMPDAEQLTLVREMVRSKAIPSIYTALTTIVAFASLLISDIRPVIDFGWMMMFGIIIAMLLAFTLFPAVLVLLKREKPARENTITVAITRFLARGNEQYGNRILLGFLR
ncbi:MAG: MMPL family transporter, partial [Desulfuromonadales bacterium]|nr:MMPL family transporter [Desulfuromonadales bacterium]